MKLRIEFRSKHGKCIFEREIEYGLEDTEANRRLLQRYAEEVSTQGFLMTSPQGAQMWIPSYRVVQVHLEYGG